MVAAPAPYRIAARRVVRLPGAALIALGCALGSGCGSARTVGPAPAPVAEPSGQVGMATFYAAHLAGRRTASGERYDPEALTAAHRSLPLGTVVRVTRIDAAGAPLSTSVVVRVNDRGPYGPGRILDLSLAAARRLGMLHAGVVRVRVQVIGRP
jgi:rare lipoprotein A